MAALGPIVAFWREFDLDNKWRGKLDEVGLKLAEHQEQSTASRRSLADATKEWKRATGDAGKASAPLVKRYQEEVDALTKRARHAEAAFLELYQELYEAPDPASALAAALEAQAHGAQLEAQVRKLSSELAEYKAESLAIKKQDLTIRKQDEVLRELQAALEAKDAELAAAKREAAAEADAAVVSRMQAREAELAEMLAGAQSSLEAMQRLHSTAQNQLFELQARSEEAHVGKQVAAEQAAEEVERAQARLAALEAEKRHLQQRLVEHSAEQATAGGGGAVEETLRQELAAQRDGAARLRSDLAAARRELQEARAPPPPPSLPDPHLVASLGEARCDALHEQLDAAAARAEGLEQQLALRPTQAQARASVEELKQQVRILQAVGYGSLDDGHAPPGGGGGGAGASGGGGARGGGAASLEGMLLAKNRRLEHELTMARLAAADNEQQLEAAQAQVSELKAQLAEKEAARRRRARARAPSAALGGAATPRRGGGGALASFASFDGGGGGGGGELDGGGGGGGGGEDSVMRVLVGQRDRLRARVKELEEALAASRGAADAARRALDTARADNVALVGRLRYVGGYRQQAAARKDAGARPGGGDVEAGSGAAGDVVGRYAQLYEERINPFKEFQGQQHEHTRRQMGVADRAMYRVGQLVYRSPLARLLAFCYLVIMHSLVFASLSHVSHRTSATLMDHQHAALLDHGLAARNDLTSLLTHDGAAAAAAGAAAREAGRRLLRRLRASTAAGGSSGAAAAAQCAGGDLACACAQQLKGAWVRPPSAVGPSCRLTVEYGGLKRTVDLFLPPSFGAAGAPPPPLWLHLHGLHAARWYPDGLPGAGVQLDHPIRGAEVDAARMGAADAAAARGAAWNVRFWSPTTILPDCQPPTTDDVAFIAHLLATLPARAGADGRRVFLSGFSNGAMLAQALLCERPAAAAALRGAALLAPALKTEYARRRCGAASGGGGGGGAPPLLIMQGTSDATLPFRPGGRIGGAPMLGADETARHWAARAGCGAGGPPARWPPSDAGGGGGWGGVGGARMECKGYCGGGGGGGGKGVVLCAVEGGGHVVWDFGGQGEVAARVWDFFTRAAGGKV
ncbi:MAG: CASP C terminal-domain-containing protein [Monoraphidium minutum]|nr:MAG: CASP C terminal-domain-containing protein [Monoraphidium minutum]